MGLQFGTADIVSMLKGPLALCCRIAGCETKAFYDESVAEGADALGEARNVASITIAILSGSVPVAFDDEVQIDGLLYRVRNFFPSDDGALTKVVLAKARPNA